MAHVSEDDVDETPLGMSEINPLLVPLEAVQVDFLETVWDSIARAHAPWPVWDFVERELYRSEHRVIDASEVFMSLPRIPSIVGPGYVGQQYGLAWRQLGGVPGPTGAPEEYVGLTIAGLVQLAARRPAVMLLADGLAEIIGWLAAAERRLVPDPRATLQPFVELGNYIEPLSKPTRELAVAIPADVVLDVLQHEFPVIWVTRNPSEQAKARLTVGLRPYLGVTCALDYLARLTIPTPSTPSPPMTPPEYLIQTLDYVSHVLAADNHWHGGPMLRIPDLRTAAALAEPVTTQAEFSYKMSALATLLAGLDVPKTGGTATAVDAESKAKPGPLLQLRDWLSARLADPAARSRVAGAIEDVRSAVTLRVVEQHPSNKTRLNAARARARLGLPGVIHDWSNAWDLVRGRVADAFDLIRQEVQLAAVAEEETAE
jgi:hypothetical protein